MERLVGVGNLEETGKYGELGRVKAGWRGDFRGNFYCLTWFDRYRRLTELHGGGTVGKGYRTINREVGALG